MKLQELASKPQLTEIIIDKEDIVEKYGESISFFIYDRLPVDTFTKLASLKSDDLPQMYGVMQDLILDEKGNPIMNEEVVLPTDILTECILKVSNFLGKSAG